MINIESPIGVFDSGVGGISVLKEAVSLMPEENYIYYGDSANAPYGTKSKEEVYNLCEKNMEFLLCKGVKAAVIACNTATSAAAEKLRLKYADIPIIGIEPAVKPAALTKDNNTVGVMATPVTLSLSKYKDLVRNYENEANIVPIPCPGLMEFVEKGELDSPRLLAYLTEVLTPFKSQSPDAIVLGCTHYPFAKAAIEKVSSQVFEKKVHIFDGSYGTAMELKRRLILAGLKQEPGKKGEIQFYNSLPMTDELSALCKQLLSC